MRKLFYCGLEAYEERYTLQLTKWNTTIFKDRKIDYVVVPGIEIDNTKKIQVGQVLDAHGRSYYSMSQMMNLVQLMRNGEVTGNDVVFFEDMFQPGIESLPYIMNQIPEEDRPQVWVRCLAQTIDPDDFVHVWNMDKWMRHFESMVNEFVTGILASSEEMVANMKVAGWTAPIYNISGLAFNDAEVRSRITQFTPFKNRAKRVVFASRWDQEKQPGFFMDLIEAYSVKYGNATQFILAQGSSLRSNNPLYVDRARRMEQAGQLVIKENLSKNEYYEILNNSRVLINTARQDWISNTISEADALGCNVLFPAYRSFPEILNNDKDRLYIPWSIEDAIEKLHALIATPNPNIGQISSWTTGTVGRCLDIMQEPANSKWNRNTTQYRDFLPELKY